MGPNNPNDSTDLRPAFWITGLSASGKTTLASNLAGTLAAAGPVDLLDGEDLRRRLPRQYGHSLEDRYEVLCEFVKIAKESQERGNLVIVSAIAHKLSMRKHIREALDPYFEIYLKADVAGCASRDKKGHYERVLSGSGEYFAGVSEPYEEGGADLVLAVDGKHASEVFDLASTFIERVLGARASMGGEAE